MINNEIKEIIQNFYSVRQDKIAFIYLGGSACLPYIRNAHDLDIYIIYNEYSDDETRRQNRNDRLLLKEQLLKIDSRITVVSEYKYIFDYWVDETKKIEGVRFCHFPSYIYETPTFELICGEDITHVKEINILNVKPRYINAMLEFFPTVKKIYEEEGRIIKSLYHILTGLYILQNNSYELTSEQIENINIVHDTENKEKVLELYNWVSQQLDSLSQQ